MTLPRAKRALLTMLAVDAAFLCLICCASCNGQQSPQAPGGGESAPAESVPAESTTQDANAAAFDGERAYDLLVKQCEFGPRNPGGEGHRACGEWLIERLDEWCDEVLVQEFTHTSTMQFPGQTFEMRNLIGVVEPEGGRTETTREVLLVAHWDCRPISDRDPNPMNRSKPILGANDGASGVAAALEIARCLSLDPAPTAVIIILTDGEDFGVSGDPGLREWFLGSRRFAENPLGFDPKRGILLDIIGDKNVEIGRETYSYQADPSLVERIWATAEDLGRDDVFVNTRYTVSDDHLPLIAAGIPVVDLIDWRPEVTDVYWHTQKDTPENCSAEALEAVGEVVLAVLREGI